jgi:hypothetical protein
LSTCSVSKILRPLRILRLNHSYPAAGLFIICSLVVDDFEHSEHDRKDLPDSSSVLPMAAGNKVVADNSGDHHQSFGSTIQSAHLTGRRGSPGMPVHL